MSDKKDNGGAAISLRDYFAGSATEGDINKYREYYEDSRKVTKRFLFWTWEEDVFIRIRARYTREQARYRFADALLAARSAK